MSNTVLYDKPGFAKVVYDPSHKVVVQTFEQATSDAEELRRMEESTIQAFFRYKTTKGLTDHTRITQPFPLALYELVEHDFVPRMVQNGMRYLATIMPTSGLGKIAMRNWQPGAERAGLTIMNFASLKDAMAWLDELK